MIDHPEKAGDRSDLPFAVIDQGRVGVRASMSVSVGVRASVSVSVSVSVERER